MKKEFFAGVKDGIPIGLGYLSVSFGFGILAVASGLSLLSSTLLSAVNLTSAGQAAGVAVMAAGGSLLEMALTQLVINLRYSLFGITLSQNLAPSFTFRHRFFAAFGFTDEIFAMASSRSEPLTPFYMYGITAPSFVGWVSGTFLGAAAGDILPASVSGAMGILLYGMFIAIFVPPAKKSLSVLAVVIMAMGLNSVIYYFLPFISVGFSIIISACLSAAAGALLFPREVV